MQGNKVLTGNIIILTHDRPIHKTNSWYLGPPQRAVAWEIGPLSPGPWRKWVLPGGGAASPARSDACLGSELFVRGRKMIIFKKKHKSQSITASLLVTRALLQQKTLLMLWYFASHLPCQCRKHYGPQRPVSSPVLALQSRLDCCQCGKTF